MKMNRRIPVVTGVAVCAVYALAIMALAAHHMNFTRTDAAMVFTPATMQAMILPASWINH